MPLVKAESDDFYGTIGLRTLEHTEELPATLSNLEVAYNPALSIGLGYKFPAMTVYSNIDFPSLEISDASGASIEYSTVSWVFGLAHDFNFGQSGWYGRVGAEYSFDDEISNNVNLTTIENENTLSFATSIGYSNSQDIGPIGINIGLATDHDPLFTGLELTDTRINVEYPGIIGLAPFFIAAVISTTDSEGVPATTTSSDETTDTSTNGRGVSETTKNSGFAWDLIPDGRGSEIWRCRNKESGQFAKDVWCAGLPKIDATWPGV